MPYILGIDIGGTKCGVLLANYDGADVAFLDKRAFPTEGGGPDAIVARLAAESEALLAARGLNGGEVAAAGVNCGGPLDAAAGVILSPPNLPGWDDVPIVSILERRLGVRAFLENDANAGAMAEHFFGAGRGCDHLMFLTFGTGMGAGLILNGRLYAGANSMAGEVGHIRLARSGPVGFGKEGSFEGFCSGGGLGRMAQAMAAREMAAGRPPLFCVPPDAPITARSVADAARKGDPTALELFRVSGQRLGEALAVFIDALNPQLILIGSVFAKCESLLRPSMEEALAREAIPRSLAACRIAPAGLGDSINDYEPVAIAVHGLGLGK